MYYSGCNYYKNTGANEYEPIGTATSMHDCDRCDKLDCCKVKKTEETWAWNEDIEQQMQHDWDQMNSENR